LGYFVDPENKKIQDHILKVQKRDLELTRDYIRYLEVTYNYHISVDQLETKSLHTFYSMMLVKKIAAELFSNNPQMSMEAFLAGLHWLGINYADFSPWNVENAIEIIHAAGGIAVLAHPGGKEDKAMRSLGFLIHEEKHIRQYLEYGIDGIEVSNPVHSNEEKIYYYKLAKKLKLLPTYGSDCHGDDPFLGPALMETFQDVPENSYEVLCDYYQNRKLESFL
jgi:hypothetical protein